MELHQGKRGLQLQDCHLDLQDLDHRLQQKDNQKQQRHHSIMKQERQSELQEHGGQPELQERGDRLDLQERGYRLDLHDRGGLPELLQDHGCPSRPEPRELGGRLEPQKLGRQPEQWELVGRPKFRELNGQPEPRKHRGRLEPPELQEHEGWAELHRQGRKKQLLLREPQWHLHGNNQPDQEQRHAPLPLQQQKQQRHGSTPPQEHELRHVAPPHDDDQKQFLELRALRHYPHQAEQGLQQQEQQEAQQHDQQQVIDKNVQEVCQQNGQHQKLLLQKPQQQVVRKQSKPFVVWQEGLRMSWLQQQRQPLPETRDSQERQPLPTMLNLQEREQLPMTLVPQKWKHLPTSLDPQKREQLPMTLVPQEWKHLPTALDPQKREQLPATRGSQEWDQLSMRLDVQERGHLQTKQSLQHSEDHEVKELQPLRQEFRGVPQGDRRSRTFQKVLVEIGMDLCKKFIPNKQDDRVIQMLFENTEWNLMADPPSKKPVLARARRPLESAQATNMKRIPPAPKTTGPSALARSGKRFFCLLCGKGGFNQELFQQHLSMEHSLMIHNAVPRVVQGLPPPPPRKMEPPHFLPPGYVVATNESARLSTPSQPPPLLLKPVRDYSSFGLYQPRSPMPLPSNDQMLFLPRQQRYTFLKLSQLMTTPVSTTTSKTTTQPNLVMYNITPVGNVLNPLYTTNFPTLPAARQIPQQSRGFKRGQALSASEQISKKGRPSWKDHVNTFTANEHFKHERTVTEMLHLKKRTQLGCDQSGFSPVVMVKRLKLKHTEVGVTVSEQEIAKILKADKYLQQPFRSKKLEPNVLFKDHEDLCAENEVNIDAVQRGMKVAQSLAQERTCGLCFFCPKIVRGPRQEIREQLAKHLAFSHGAVRNYDEVHKQVRYSCIHCQNPLGYPLSQYSLNRHHERCPSFSVTESPVPNTSPATVADVGQPSAPRCSSTAIVSTELKNTSEKLTTVVSGPAKGEKMSELQMK